MCNDDRRNQWDFCHTGASEEIQLVGHQSAGLIESLQFKLRLCFEQVKNIQFHLKMVVIIEGVDLALYLRHFQTEHLCSVNTAGGLNTVDFKILAFLSVSKFFHVKFCALEE